MLGLPIFTGKKMRDGGQQLWQAAAGNLLGGVHCTACLLLFETDLSLILGWVFLSPFLHVQIH